MDLDIFWQAWQAPLARGQVNQPENICSNIKEGLFVEIWKIDNLLNVSRI